MARQKKIELIAPEAFSGLSNDAKRKLCVGAVSGAPRFVVEIAKGMPAPFCFDTGFSERSVIEEAVSKNSLALVRWACARLARSPARSVRAPKYAELLARALKSDASDAEALRMRRWLRGALFGVAKGGMLHQRSGGEDLSVASLTEMEARIAFSHGRPAVGAALCEELLSLDPDAVALACVPAQGLGKASLAQEQARFSALTWRLDGSVDSHAWRSKLTWQRIEDDGRRERDDFNQLTPAPLAAQAGRWADALRGASQISGGSPQAAALAERLAQAGDRLWALGALSTPDDFASRTISGPELSPDALRRQREGLASLARGEDQLMVGPLWLQACDEPSRRVGPKKEPLWDLFCSRFAGAVRGVDPNPFTVFDPGTCPALWSLRSGGRLVELGLERGFDPLPISRVAVLKQALGQAVIASQSPKAPSPQEWAPAWAGHAAVGAWGLSSWSLGVKACRIILPGGKGARTKLGEAIKTERDFDNMPWTRTNFATLALLAGQPDLARRLTEAGCEAPSSEAAVAEARELRAGKDVLGRLESHWAAFEMALDLRLRSKKTKKSATEPPSQPANLRL